PHADAGNTGRRCVRRALSLARARSTALVRSDQVTLDLGSRDIRGAREVDHLALPLEEVELPFPVVSDDEGVDVVARNVVRLLLPGRLRDHEVDEPDRLEHPPALLPGVVAALALARVELVGGERHYQVVAKRSCTPEQLDVSVVEQIVGAVRDHSLHALTFP